MQVIAISVCLELANTDALKMTFCVIIKQFVETNAHPTQTVLVLVIATFVLMVHVNTDARIKQFVEEPVHPTLIVLMQETALSVYLEPASTDVQRTEPVMSLSSNETLQ